MAAHPTHKPIVRRYPAAAPAAQRSASAPQRSTRERQAVTPKQAIRATTNSIAIAAPVQASRANSCLASLESIQEPRVRSSKRVPRWRKIITWVLMLMPVYAIIIYLVGFFYFWGHDDIGINASLPSNIASIVGSVAVPDHEGTFLQTADATGKPTLSQILPYTDRNLMPPVTSQVNLKSTDLRYILIRQAQVSLPTEYRIYRVESGKADIFIKVVGKRVPATRIALMSLALPNDQAWSPGTYMIVVPSSGLAPEDSWAFFTVQP